MDCFLPSVRRLTVKELAKASLIASVYVILSLVFLPISFGVYQVRVAEALTVLPFLTPAAVPGLYIGCLLANIFGGMGWLDIVLGPLITLAAAVLTRLSARLTRSPATDAFAVLPVLLLYAGAIYFLTGLSVNLAMMIGLVILFSGLAVALLAQRVAVSRPEKGTLPIWLRVGAVALSLGSIFLLMNAPSRYFLWVGCLMLLAALFSAMALMRIRAIGRRANLLVAPLPPVLLNAFGVSIYLAPIMGVNYWFAVQMIGVGQLIACYFIGLPLLLVLDRRKVFFY